MIEKPVVTEGQVLFGGSAVIRSVYQQPSLDGSVFSAVVNPVSPAAYDFKWENGRFEQITTAIGGSYIRPGHPDWHYAVTLRRLAGIKNPETYSQ